MDGLKARGFLSVVFRKVVQAARASLIAEGSDGV